MKNFATTVPPHLQHKYQEGEDQDCKLICADGHVMVCSKLRLHLNMLIFRPILSYCRLNRDFYSRRLKMQNGNVNRQMVKAI